MTKKSIYRLSAANAINPIKPRKENRIVFQMFLRGFGSSTGVPVLPKPAGSSSL
jgi:hypothetical protein